MADMNEILIEFVSMQTDRSLRRIATEMKLTVEELKAKVDSRMLDSTELLDFVRCSRSEKLLDEVLNRLRPQPTAGKPRVDTASSSNSNLNRKRLLN